MPGSYHTVAAGGTHGGNLIRGHHGQRGCGASVVEDNYIAMAKRQPRCRILINADPFQAQYLLLGQTHRHGDKPIARLKPRGQETVLSQHQFSVCRLDKDFFHSVDYLGRRDQLGNFFLADGQNRMIHIVAYLYLK